jgi:hypothetical protein
MIEDLCVMDQLPSAGVMPAVRRALGKLAEVLGIHAQMARDDPTTVNETIADQQAANLFVIGENLNSLQIIEQRWRRRPGSGRPPGRRNNVPREVSLVAQDFGIEALETLVRIMRDERQPAASRVCAAGMVLDRGYGRAPAADVPQIRRCRATLRRRADGDYPGRATLSNRKKWGCG